MAQFMDNSGKAKLQVPGFGDVPLNYELPCETRFAHGIEEWVQTPAVTFREFAMTSAMNMLTDKKGWHEDVFNDSVLARWKDEICAKYQLISKNAWSWCIEELQDKAAYFAKKRFVQVLDTGSCICKSDDLLPEAFALELQKALEPLSKGKAPGETIVDSNAYPLIYGITGVLSSGGSTGLDTRQHLYAYGAVTTSAPEQPDEKTDVDEVDKRMQEAGGLAGFGFLRAHSCFNTNPRNYYWSTRYQALPCEVSFTSDAKSVSIDTYVNNVHPSYSTVYTCLEKIIAAAVEPWNDCLIEGRSNWVLDRSNRFVPGINVYDQFQRGRIPLRIVTFGVECADSLPSWAIALDGDLEEEFNDAECEQDPSSGLTRGGLDARPEVKYDALQALLPIPKSNAETWKQAEEYLHLPNRSGVDQVEPPPNWKGYPILYLARKADSRLSWLHPEPSTVLSYQDWKAGCNVDRAILSMDDRSMIDDSPSKNATPTHTPYSIDLIDTFRKSGLQVIVKVASLHIPAGVDEHEDLWRLQGNLNEHIVATAIYAYKSSNVSAKLSFRQETPMPGNLYRDDGRRAPRWVREEDSYRFTDLDYGKAFRNVFGVSEHLRDPHAAPYHLPVQELGDVALVEGRLITFPNVMESRIAATLIDPSRDGCLSYVSINLVDPHFKICSTRNVPPQQRQWNDPIMRVQLRHKGLPSELVDRILEESHLEEESAEACKEKVKEIDRLHIARYTEMIRDGWYDEYSV